MNDTAPAVLVVEDHADNGVLLAMAFEQVGLDVLVVATVEAARHALNARRFDAIIADYSLPDGNASHIFPGLPAEARPRLAILLTGLPADSLSGVDDFQVFLLKPADLGRLTAMLERIIKKAPPEPVLA